MDTAQNSEIITLVVRQVITETADTKSFVLAYKHDPGNFPSYQAGQFLTFVFTRANGAEARRNYSISSSLAMGEPLTITVKRIPNGEFSRRFVDYMQPGEELQSLGASGLFVLPGNMAFYRQLFFFAAGSGITPIFSLLKTVLVQHPHVRVVLVYSNKNKASTIFYEQLIILGRQFKERLIVEFIFSNAFDLLTARLNAHLLNRITSNYREFPTNQVLYYVCGPLDYMRLVTIHLQTEGVEPGHLRKEIFHIEKPAKMPQPPDRDQHQVTLRYKGADHYFSTRYPVTILQAAKQAGLSLPYSCESGQCGTCIARCTAGSVWMYNNEVLTEDELAKGLVLTCTGFPIKGDISLEV